ncbi:MAG: TraR/DksA family transcriptional regulator [Nitrospirota bacterium]|nr:TraR/DksA family transcriptional regulator [Nitrospirota bacterium]
MAEELSEPQRATLGERLTRLRAELEARLRATADDAKPVDLGLPIGRLSRMDAIQQQQMSAAGRANYERQLAQVKLALARMDDGEYGACRECGEPVGFPRLSARPETPFCVVCQGALES